jgi:hypothetical protein
MPNSEATYGRTNVAIKRYVIDPKQAVDLVDENTIGKASTFRLVAEDCFVL